MQNFVSLQKLNKLKQEEEELSLGMYWQQMQLRYGQKCELQARDKIREQ